MPMISRTRNTWIANSSRARRKVRYFPLRGSAEEASPGFGPWEKCLGSAVAIAIVRSHWFYRQRDENTLGWASVNRLLTADPALAPSNEPDEMRGRLGRNLRFDPMQRVRQFQPRPVQQRVCGLQALNLCQAEAGSLQPHQVQTLWLHRRARIHEERRRVLVDPRHSANHRQPANLGKLVNTQRPGNKRLILDLDVARHQHATADHGVVADPAIVGDVARSHDVVPVPDHRFRRRLSPTRNSEMLADLVPAAHLQVAPRTGE